MKRYLAIGAVLALLALPLVAGAQSTDWMNCRSWDDTGCMPSWWNPYPPPSKTIDVGQLDASQDQLIDLLVKKGVVTQREAAQLTQPQTAASTSQGREIAQEPGASSLSTR